MPRATATAEPELEPPGTSAGSQAVARHGIGRAHADEAGGELVEIGLADDERARALRSRATASASRSRRIGKVRTGRGGRQAGDVDVVLDRERARPRAARAIGSKAPSAAACAFSAASGASEMKMPGSPAARAAPCDLLDDLFAATAPSR